MEKLETLPNGSSIFRGKLANGVDLWLIEDHRVPAVATHTWVRCGAIHEKMDSKLNRTGLAHLFEHLMFRGTKRFADGKFDKILTELGAHDSNATTWLERTHYYQYVPKESVEQVVDLERDRMTNITLSSAVFEVERKAVLSEFKLGQDDPEIVAFHHLYEEAFEEHPYRYGTIGKEEEIKSFTLEEAQYFYAKYYSAQNLSLFFAGDLESNEYFDLISKYYENLPVGVRADAVNLGQPAPTPEKRFCFKHAQISNPLLLVGYHAPSVNDSDHAAMVVLKSLLCHGQQSYFALNCLDQGLVSSIEGDLDQFQKRGLFSVCFDVSRNHDCDEILAVLDKAGKHLQTWSKEAWKENLSRARNQIVLSQMEAFSDPHSLAGWLGEFLISAKSPMRAIEILDQVDKINRDQILEVYEEYLRPDRKVVVIGEGTQS